MGNNGKTFLSYFLRDMCQAMRVPNVNSNDSAFAYRYEKIVVFDYTRESKDHINYDLLEDLKNGSIWSPKYQSAVKTWKYNVKVICFSNFPPKYEALSHDRWNVLELRDGKLRRTRAPQPQAPPTPYIVEDTLQDTQDEEEDPPPTTTHTITPQSVPRGTVRGQQFHRYRTARVTFIDMSIVCFVKDRKIDIYRHANLCYLLIIP